MDNEWALPNNVVFSLMSLNEIWRDRYDTSASCLSLVCKIMGLESFQIYVRMWNLTNLYLCNINFQTTCASLLGCNCRIAGQFCTNEKFFMCAASNSTLVNRSNFLIMLVWFVLWCFRSRDIKRFVCRFLQLLDIFYTKSQRFASKVFQFAVWHCVFAKVI